MKTKIIGVGAAGNKAVVDAIIAGYPRGMCLLLNSTFKDVPKGFEDISKIISQQYAGCGKESNIGYEIMEKALSSDVLDLEEFFNASDAAVVVVSSTEGGTGCGGSTILGKYINQVFELPVHMFAFTGFEEDGRGLQNTIEYFQKLDDGLVVHTISNKKFLNGTTNKIRAEKLANAEFVHRINILTGNIIKSSDQNIDDTDLYKLINQPGYSTIEFTTMDRPKNNEQFNKILSTMIDDSPSLSYDPSAKRIGVIMCIHEKTKDAVDFSFKVLREKMGNPYEIFQHIQEIEEGESEFIAVIASGMNLPTDEVKAIHDRYMNESSKVNKNKDTFFNQINSLKGNNEDAIFDMNVKQKSDIQSNKKNFFKNNTPKEDLNQKGNFVNPKFKE